MTTPVRLCLALHNHQPVGNFDHVFQQAYYDSYLPFLDVFQHFAPLRMSLHISGPLAEWLDEHHPEYLDRVAELVAAGRIEIIGGAFYEPILSMIPSWDRVGQITAYSEWLQRRLGAQVHGMWIPERVWEQALTSDLSAAGIQYTILDDFHFKAAGLADHELLGYYLTEDSGSLLRVFPGSERLRYLIPFRMPPETIDYLRQVGQAQPGAVVVFGDDGEKFGTWPETKKHVYEDGWLSQFFQLLLENQDWLISSTLYEATTALPPVGRVYLPDASYREMTEWALPVSRQKELEGGLRWLGEDARGSQLRGFVRGGYWRNFKVKYPETNEMYCRMMQISRRLRQATQQGPGSELLQDARRELYRGQCNCSYWHGAFGGVYLPHLRHAVYKHLIAAENLLDRALDRPAGWIEAQAHDFNLDGRTEVSLGNEKLQCFVAPAHGGQLYELDVRSICHNLLATLARREEVYHEKVRNGAASNVDHTASIHERVHFKQEGLEHHLIYDPGPRRSLVDRFFDPSVPFDDYAAGRANDLGDFAAGESEARIRRKPDRIQIQMVRDGRIGEHPVRLTKGVTLESGQSVLEIAYLLENLPPGRVWRMAVELHFAGLPPRAEDRYYYQTEPHAGDRQRLGQFESRLALDNTSHIGLIDEWLGLNVHLSTSRPTGFWTLPVETVSQSEGGFELVHQAVQVAPHWLVEPDQDGRWSVVLRMAVDTSLAESRAEQVAALV